MARHLGGEAPGGVLFAGVARPLAGPWEAPRPRAAIGWGVRGRERRADTGAHLRVVALLPVHLVRADVDEPPQLPVRPRRLEQDVRAVDVRQGEVEADAEAVVDVRLRERGAGGQVGSSHSRKQHEAARAQGACC